MLFTAERNCVSSHPTGASKVHHEVESFGLSEANPEVGVVHDVCGAEVGISRVGTLQYLARSTPGDGENSMNVAVQQMQRTSFPHGKTAKPRWGLNRIDQ